MATIESKGVTFGERIHWFPHCDREDCDLDPKFGVSADMFQGGDHFVLYASADVVIGDYTGFATVYFHRFGRQRPSRWVVTGLTARDSFQDFGDTYPSMNVIRKRIGERNLSARQNGRPTQSYTLPRNWSGFTHDAWGTRHAAEADRALSARQAAQDESLGDIK